MTSQATTQIESPSLGRRIVSWAFRGGVAGLILWLSVWSLQGISAFVRPVTATQPDAKPEFNPLQFTQSLDLASGAWQFLDDGGDISAAALSAPEAERRILALPAVTFDDNRSQTGEFQDVLHVMRLQGEVTAAGGLWRFSLQQMGFHVVAFTRDQAGRNLLAIRWLIPLGHDKFWLVEQTPSDRKHAVTSKAKTIIPRSITSRVLAMRSDKAGNQICQLIQVDSSLAVLLGELGQEGWQIEAPMGELKPGFATIYLSRQAASCWMVASPNSDATSLRILILNDGASADAPSKRLSLDDHQ